MDRDDFGDTRRRPASAKALWSRPRPLSPSPNAPTYDEDVTAKMAAMFDQLGGIEKLVRNKTVTVKVNMTGAPSQRFQGMALGLTHYTHPKVVGRDGVPAGARGREAHTLRGKRVGHGGTAGRRDPGFGLESARAAIGRDGRGVREHQCVGQAQEVCALQISGQGLHVSGVRDEPGVRRYRRVRQPGEAQESCRLRRDALAQELLRHTSRPRSTATMREWTIRTRSPTQGRAAVVHFGKRQPAKIAPAELLDASVQPGSPTLPDIRVSRVVADLAVVRPIHLADYRRRGIDGGRRRAVDSRCARGQARAC